MEYQQQQQQQQGGSGGHFVVNVPDELTDARKAPAAS